MESLLILIGTIVVTLPQQMNAFNLALGKDSKQSSTYDTFDSSLGVNGEIITRSPSYEFLCAHTENRADTSWWAVDLGDTYTISTIIIYGRTDCCPEYLVNFDVDVIAYPYCLSDKWGKTKNCYFEQNNTQFLNITCQTNTHGRFVRIKNRGHNYLVVCEVEVYGQPLPIFAALKMNSVKACGFVGKEYTVITIRSCAARSRMDCVTYCINDKSCCAAEYQDAEKKCTLKSRAENIIDTYAFFMDAQGKNTFLLK